MSDYKRRRLPHRDDEHLEHSFVGDTVNRGKAWVGERKKEAHAYIDRAKNAAGQWIYAYPGQMIRNGKVVSVNAYNKAREKASAGYQFARDRGDDLYRRASGTIRRGTRALDNARRETRKAYQHATRRAGRFIDDTKDRLGLSARSEYKRRQAQAGRTKTRAAANRAKNSKFAYDKTLLGRAENYIGGRINRAVRRGKDAIEKTSGLRDYRMWKFAENNARRGKSMAVNNQAKDYRFAYQNSPIGRINNSSVVKNARGAVRNASKVANTMSKRVGDVSSEAYRRGKKAVDNAKGITNSMINRVLSLKKKKLTDEQIAQQLGVSEAVVSSIRSSKKYSNGKWYNNSKGGGGRKF